MNILEARRRTLGKGVYKKTVEGNPAIAQGSLARMYPGIKMQGWTEQTQYEGKNLLPVDVEQEFTGVVATDSATFEEDGVHAIYESIVSGEARDIYLYGDSNTSVESGYVEVPNLTPGNYRLVNDNIGISLYVVAWRNGSSVVLGYADNVSAKITVQNGDKFRIFLRCNIIGGTDVKIHPMIVKEGEDTTTYEPYTGGQPSPNPDYPQEIISAGEYSEETQKYEYKVKLTGKNLWDTTKAADKSKWVQSTSQNGYSDFAIDVATGQSITVSFPEKLPTGLEYFVGIVLEENGKIAQWMYHSTVEMLIHQQATVTSIVDKIWIRCNTFVISNFVLENPLFQIEYGSQRTEYAPYQDQAVTLTVDRPLTKWDRLEKRNGQWGWVYKSAEIVLDGSEDEDWMLQADTNRKTQFYITLSDALYPYSDPFKEMFYCDTFLTTNNLGAIPKWQVRKGMRNGLAPVFKPGDDINTVYLFRAFLAENPTTILYVTKEETFVPLSGSEQEAMNALYTFRPTTVLSNDCNCDMTLTYKTKKSLEVTT